MARPRKEIDRKDFESLLAIQCTLKEVTSFFDHKLDGCSEDTIERWCRREYGESFADVSAKKRALGAISLRRSQFKLAEKNAVMSIWLGKQHLGQTDNPLVVETKTDDDGFMNALSNSAVDDWEGVQSEIEE